MMRGTCSSLPLTIVNFCWIPGSFRCSSVTRLLDLIIIMMGMMMMMMMMRRRRMMMTCWASLLSFQRLEWRFCSSCLSRHCGCPPHSPSKYEDHDHEMMNMMKLMVTLKDIYDEVEEDKTVWYWWRWWWRRTSKSLSSFRSSVKPRQNISSSSVILILSKSPWEEKTFLSIFLVALAAPYLPLVTHWLTVTLEILEKEWLLRLETPQTLWCQVMSRL